ncbi:hypothetical protein [Candidatus Nanohalovita haloferacivicina]|uniref:hypothetical protein n=1 Tax=Candidatus Nanohalovita haloferacivicina TaxID=2978046 RepID=UPI00325FD4F6|nr:hypothetical protein HBNXNv_0416 [Candidatus Nanohalobia archaeon BNXNv]
METKLTENENYESTVKAFMDGQAVGQYESNGDGSWATAAFSDEVPVQDVNGIDVVGDVSEDVLVYVDSDAAREVDAELDGREYLENVFEYNVDVEVVNDNGEVVQQDSGMFLSGGSDQVSPYVWAQEAVAKVTDDQSVQRIDSGSGASSGGELDFLLDEEEKDDGIDVIR